VKGQGLTINGQNLLLKNSDKGAVKPALFEKIPILKICKL